MASKANRAKKHAEKMRKKRAEKAARKSQYAALAGTSKKKKKQGKKVLTAGIYKHAHRMACCGNPGCKRCHGLLVGPNRGNVASS
jgi:hypothetical protein